MGGEHCQAHSGLANDIKTNCEKLVELKRANKESHDSMWKHINAKADKNDNDKEHQEMNTKIDRIANRPPVWATAVISVLSAAVAWFAR